MQIFTNSSNNNDDIHRCNSCFFFVAASWTPPWQCISNIAVRSQPSPSPMLFLWHLFRPQPWTGVRAGFCFFWRRSSHFVDIAVFFSAVDPPNVLPGAGRDRWKNDVRDLVVGMFRIERTCSEFVNIYIYIYVFSPKILSASSLRAKTQRRTQTDSANVFHRFPCPPPLPPPASAAPSYTSNMFPSGLSVYRMLRRELSDVESDIVWHVPILADLRWPFQPGYFLISVLISAF